MKPRSRIIALTLAAGLTLPAGAFAQGPVGFPEIWSRIRSQSPGLRASDKDRAAAEQAATRARNHWYPKVTLDSRAYVTNDAGLTFFSLLGERRADQPDFAPPQLNHPGSSLWEKASIIVDLPLYEGGQKTAIADATNLAVSAQDSAKAAAVQMELAQAAREYALILSHGSDDSALRELDKRVDDLIKRYQLGSKTNPVGYAGALGLRSLQARLHGLLERNTAARKSLLAAISVRAGMETGSWTPAAVRYDTMLNETLGIGPADEPSSYTRAMYDGAKVADGMKEAEKARHRPRAGFFVQGDFTNGDRATGASYVTGLYLQWSLFDASNNGAYEQGSLQAEAMRLRADQQAQNDTIGRIQTREALLATERNLKLIDESLELSDEQIRTSEMLFRNGSINALQLAEVLSRRADLVLARGEAERNWIEMRVRSHLASAAPEGSIQ